LHSPQTRPAVIPFPAAAIVRPPAPAFARPSVRWRLVVWATVAALGLLTMGVLGAGCWMVRSASRIERVPVRIPESLRPAHAASRGLNLLVAGLDGEGRTGIARGARSDAILVAHLDADRRKLWVVSIPRDTYEQWAALPHIAMSSLQPGDLLYYNGIGHVAMYVGNGYIIDAPSPGMSVEKISMNTSWYASTLDGAARP